MRKNVISDYFLFTKKERRGISVLLVLIIFFTILPYLFPYFITPVLYDSTSFQEEIALLKIKQADSTEKYLRTNGDFYKSRHSFPNRQGNDFAKESSIKFFHFDPNTASTTDWKNLGLRDKNIATIEKYIAKGGRFYKPEDIGKIWGLHPQEVQRLIPFVQIYQKPRDTSSRNKDWPISFKKSGVTANVDINSADVATLESLPGIGTKLSQRIVTFRDKLGGFYKIEQLAETFGLPDSTYQKIRPFLRHGGSTVNQININTADLEELKGHPYLRYTLSNAIVQFRAQHGNFKQVDDLKKIMIITGEVYTKIAPYLKVSDDTNNR